MNCQNTICAIFGVSAPVRKRMRGLLPGEGGGTFGGRIVPIVRGAQVRDHFYPVGVKRR